MSNPSKNVTIIIPVYADWPSLSQCIDSVIKHVSTRHSVILVNDCGPQVDELEKNIMAKIKRQTNMMYFRNEQNLGFVKTCNKAVYELDKTNNDILLLNSDTIVTDGFLEELQYVLYASDHHGTVCPRSNNATIATVPYLNADNTDDRSLDYSYKVYERIKLLLPRFHVVPVVIGFCMLIKRDLIRDYGLFDEVYRLGYGEECDFCQRINRYGYSSVMANHAYVYHLESRSFESDKKAKMKALNEKVLHERYPYYDELVQRYLRDFIHPVDWFADIIAGLRDKKKIMLNLSNMPAAYNGTSRNVITFLDYLQTESRHIAQLEFVIVVNKAAAIFHKLEKYGFRIEEPSTIHELFDVGYCPNQVFDIHSLIFMHRYCYRIIITVPDIIAVRSNKLLAHNYSQKMVFADSFNISDKIITISNATKKDIYDYYGDEALRHHAKFITIHQGYSNKHLFVNEQATLSQDTERLIETKDYILILGNNFDFKRVDEAIRALKECDRQIIALGKGNNTRNQDNVHYLVSGSISDEIQERIRANAYAIVFPSVYEGFGLPVVESIAVGRPVVVSRTAVNDELISYISGKAPIITFARLRDLPAAVEKAGSLSPKMSTYKVPHIDEYNDSVLKVIRECAHNTELDVERLTSRWEYMSRVTSYISDKSNNRGKSFVHTVGHIVKRRSPRLFHATKRVYNRLKP